MDFSKLIRGMLCSKIREKKAELEAKANAEKDEVKKIYYLHAIDTLDELLKKHECEE